MIDGSGRKGRILKSDVEQFVKKQLKGAPEEGQPGKPRSSDLQNQHFSNKNKKEFFAEFIFADG